MREDTGGPRVEGERRGEVGSESRREVGLVTV